MFVYKLANSIHLKKEEENKLVALEKRLKELETENKPLGTTLKHIMHVLSLEEVGHGFINNKQNSPSF